MTDPLECHRKISAFLQRQVGDPGVIGRCGVTWFALSSVIATTQQAKKMGYLPCQPSFLIFKDGVKKAIYLAEQRNMEKCPEGFQTIICCDFSGFVHMVEFYKIFRIID